MRKRPISAFYLIYHSSDTNITPGDILNKIGQSVASATFAGDRFLKYKRPEFNCGPADALRVMGEYKMLLHLVKQFPV